MKFQREPATVSDATCATHEHYQVITPWVHLTGPDGGWGQGFGGICVDEAQAKDWTESICRLFGVAELAGCVGRNCFVLRAWESYGDDIEGLEVDGRRFTLTEFRRKHWPEVPATPFDRKKARLEEDIRQHAQRIEECIQRLRRLPEGYVDWSSPSKGTDR